MEKQNKLLTDSNHQLMLIADSVPVHLNYLDCQELFVFVNKAAASWWGKTPQEMVGKSVHEIVGDEAYPELKKNFEKVLKGEAVHHEALFIREDGSTGYFLNTYTPDFDPQGRVIGFVATGTDVTEKKLAFDRAEKLASEFRILADSMPQIVWTANPDGHVDYYNRRWYDFTGLPQGSADNKLWSDIIHPDDAAHLHATWERVLKTGEAYETEFRVKYAKTGEYRWLLSRAHTVKDAQGKILKWYGSNTDIHDQKMIQRNLELQKDLRERLVSALTHDLRTPLTAAKMSSQLISRKNTDPSIQKLSFRIEENMDRADKMIQDLLDASVVKAGEKLPIKRSHCDISQIMKGVVDEHTIIHGDRFELDVPDTVRGFWDCDGIRRILENLVNNAIKYGSPTAPIVLKCQILSKEVLLSVTNLGTPIPPGDLETLFDVYKRSEIHQRSHKGWGIGLGLVKGIAEAHGGSVSVTSTAESGTTFTVSIPF